MRTQLLRGLLICWLTLSLSSPLVAEEVSTRQYTPLEELAPSAEQRRVAREVTRTLVRQHFASVALDAELEQQALENYIDQLDPNKALLTAAERQAILERTAELEAALVKGDLEFAFEVFVYIANKNKARLERNLVQLQEELDQFSFDQDQRFMPDRREQQWPTHQAELDTYWQQRLTHELLSLMDADQSIEEARDLLVRRYQNQLSRLRQTNADDIFQGFMNAFTTSVDPHTNYLSPRRSESFNIQMRLSLDGIGAVLQTENEYTKVVSLVPGGPADRQGQLRPNDRIIGVAQGAEGEIENVIGWRLDEVVDLVRGPRGSIVRLEVLNQDNTARRVIEIERNAVELEDQAASSRRIQVEEEGETRHIGIIEIPTFYLDFEGQRNNDPQYRSTTRDVARLIRELQDEGIDGLVIDLRNNGGGALQEANSLVGLFIPRGPTVQVRDADGHINVLGDSSGRVFYEGPLAVVINRLSASASEIFAGAIQDYGRGIVVGERSFGKGTVQTILDLSYGQLKITRAKFYRISGASTQHRGVEPDIAFPPLFDPDRIGESASPNALAWDQVQPAVTRRHADPAPLIATLLSSHQQRIQEDANFLFLQEQSEWLRRHNGAPSISLNLTERQREQQQDEDEQLAMENRRRERLGLEQLSQLEEVDLSSEEPTPLDQAILYETGRILVDYTRLVSQHHQ